VSADRATKSTEELTVTVSGGSMGGLFTGLALDHAGHDVTVFEQSTGELRSRGGGIVTQRAVERVLSGHCAVDIGRITTTSERRYLDADGGVRSRRAESMTSTPWDALYRALRDAVPDGRYHTGRRAVAVTPETAGATFADGTERATDLLVAAEGGQSATRGQLFPDVSPEFAEYVAWRGLAPESTLPAAVVGAFDDRVTFYRGAEQLVLAYFVPGPDGGTDPGQRRLDWVWYDALSGRDRRETFTDDAGTERRVTVPPGRLRDPIERRRRERAASTLPPVFAELVAATADPFVQAVYDLTVPAMTVDRACLLGDAAFVARPHTAAGTAKAAG
jgi:2-polyprenyl-6-methoxyphenol hydroxylase-like FAD-dependent oxidoreductase